MSAARGLAGHVGVSAACEALGLARATFYRRRRPKTGQRQSRPAPARALSEAERSEVFEVLCSARFADRAPAEVYATLLDEGVYLCSERTMYRVLAENKAVRERRAQRSHPNHPKPEVVARAPNEVWSWDITRLLGPEKWQYFYLYVILDIFSRYVTGWMVAERETAGLAGRLIEEGCLKHGVQPRVLTLHSDRGSPMTGKCTAQLLADLGITQSLSRPRISNDNPYSEAQFKTVKHHPGFPGRFGSIEEAKDRFRSLFLPQARLMPVSSQHGENCRRSSVGAITPDEFAANASGSFAAEGFYEIEIGSVTEQYGDIAHRFSSYASFRTDDPDEEPFNRGINSFQLLHDGDRWWVLSIFWQHEPDAGPIPAEYLNEM